MSPAKRVTIRQVGSRKRRTLTLLAPPFPALGDIVRCQTEPEHKYEVIRIEDTEAWILPVANQKEH